MDVSFLIDNGKFNFRVAGLLIHNNKILIMNDERGSYNYLPGGRVKLNESVEEAILRELKEELNIEGKIVRPLWFNEAFFKEQMSGIDYHEICMYFLIDISETDLLSRGNEFTLYEGIHTFNYKWVTFEELNEIAFYPLFLKDEIFSLPENLEILTEYQ